MTNHISGSPFEPALGVTSYTVSSVHFSAGQTYYWQVGAIAANDVGGWGVYGPSPPWSITITEQLVTTAFNPIPLYRLYKYNATNTTRDHFYTTNLAERIMLWLPSDIRMKGSNVIFR